MLFRSETYITTALIAVPEDRLVTSVLQQKRYVTSGVNVFSHGSNFFMVIAPVSSIIDFKNVGLGNRALHLPHILSRQLAEDLPLCLIPFLFWPLSLWLLNCTSIISVI